MKKQFKNKDNNYVFDLYWKWSEYNKQLKEHYSRGANLHEAITEIICSYVNDYDWKDPNKGSADAISKNGTKIQVKATSVFDNDLTSFGPRSEFDILEFMRLDQTTDIFYFYRIPIEFLQEVYVNNEETFYEKQLTGQRPRFSIVNKLIIPHNLKPYATLNMRTGELEIYDEKK
ncbi:Bsp6I family type II restriction endonuclease [Mycoplasma seminis]|uniref:Bsp6I family type II restriction endonuclease n=1 Tax=Mycoplasma seminis TaxID=512749 RepID=A0ABY9HAW5_9MOLU|nr:Bsp6I family type II restriction endonuclease [Mycoplasma seminis]WLP85616.1 Bsp6I family type II restriction endonuclease [Mycoplasma seminis]